MLGRGKAVLVVDCDGLGRYGERVLAGPERSDQVAVLCSQLPTLRRLYRGPVSARARAVLDQAVAAARSGVPVSDYLAELRIAVASGPAEGVQDGEGRSRSYGPTAVGGAPVYLPGQYVCPRGVCARAEYRTTESGLPECDVFDLALRFVEER
jgi:hypothetical protein